MGTVEFIRSRYALLWLLGLVLAGTGMWWLLFRAAPPPGLGPVNATEVKVDVFDPKTDPATPSERPDPARAFLSEAEFSLTSKDGSTRLDVKARQAEKQDDTYRLKTGTMRFVNGDNMALELTITDVTYIEEKGIAYVEGSVQGELPGTGQAFSAMRLKWDGATNVVHAEQVTYKGAHVDVSGDRMRVQLPQGIVQFEGPVTARVSSAA